MGFTVTDADVLVSHSFEHGPMTDGSFPTPSDYTDCQTLQLLSSLSVSCMVILFQFPQQQVSPGW